MKRFPKDLGAIVCRCVLERRKPILFVSHAGGDWQMYCSDKAHDFDDEAAMDRELTLAHVHHLVEWDPTLKEIANLKIDMGAERTAVGAAWKFFVDKDDGEERDK